MEKIFTNVSDPAICDRAAREMLSNILSVTYEKSRESAVFNELRIGVESLIDNMEAHTADPAKDYANEIEQLESFLVRWKNAPEFTDEMLFLLNSAFYADKAEEEDEYPVPMREAVCALIHTLNKVIELTPTPVSKQKRKFKRPR